MSMFPRFTAAVRAVYGLLLISLCATPALAQDKQLARAATAIAVLTEVQGTPDSQIPAWLLDKSYAIAVIPEVVKAGFVVGGHRGRGLISVRSPDGTWSNPSYLTMTGGSVGFQGGLQSSDIILVFRTQRGVDNLVHGKFTLGADASIAAGPVGRQAQASTDSELKAEIISYARTRGLFAGVALDGTALTIDHRANERVYGLDVTARMIFQGRVTNVPADIVRFRDQLEEQTAR